MSATPRIMKSGITKTIALCSGLLMFSLAVAQDAPRKQPAAKSLASAQGDPGPLVVYDALPDFLAAIAGLGAPHFNDFERNAAQYLPSNQFAACIEPVSSQSNDACFKPNDLAGINIASNNARGVIVMNSGIYGMPSRTIAAWPYRLNAQSYTVVRFDEPPTAVAADVYGFAMGDGAQPVDTAPVQIDVYAGDDSLIGSVTVEPTAFTVPVFVGFTSPIPIARIVYGTHIDYSAGPIDNLYFAGGSGRLSIDAADFGAVDVGDAATLPVPLHNSGYLPLALGALAQPSVPFSFDADACSGTTLAPGASCVVQVRFAPQYESDFAQSIAVPSDDPASPTPLQLEGTGALAIANGAGGGR
jgi:hypothetical protein